MTILQCSGIQSYSSTSLMHPMSLCYLIHQHYSWIGSPNSSEVRHPLPVAPNSLDRNQTSPIQSWMLDSSAASIPPQVWGGPESPSPCKVCSLVSFPHLASFAVSGGQSPRELAPAALSYLGPPRRKSEPPAFLPTGPLAGCSSPLPGSIPSGPAPVNLN